MGNCGTNTQHKTAWGQGFGATGEAAAKAAQADFLASLQEETAWLTDWAKNLRCPHQCKYKIETELRKHNHHQTAPYWNSTKNALVVDITEDLALTVYCFPAKLEDMQA